MNKKFTLQFCITVIMVGVTFYINILVRNLQFNNIHAGFFPRTTEHTRKVARLKKKQNKKTIIQYVLCLANYFPISNSKQLFYQNKSILREKELPNMSTGK